MNCYFKVSKAQLARQNITIQTCDGQAQQKFGYRLCVCRYRGGMNRLRAFQQNVGEPQEQYKGVSRIKEASGRWTPGVRQKEKQTYGVPAAVETVIPEKWMKMYIRRILEAPEEDEQGNLHGREGRGTPQGGVISPVLANLFLHYALDRWLEIHHPQCRFARYADDVVIHCRTLTEAQKLMQALKERMAAVKLRVNETKSKIAYCKDSWRKGNHEHNSFKFLGFQFQPRTFRSKSGKLLQSFKPAISIDNQTKIRDAIRTTIYWHSTNQTLELIAELLNSKLRGWVAYFYDLGKAEFRKTMGYLQEKLANWIKRKFKITGIYQSWRRLKQFMKSSPNLFYHW